MARCMSLRDPIILEDALVSPQGLRLAFSVSPCGGDACKAPTNASLILMVPPMTKMVVLVTATFLGKCVVRASTVDLHKKRQRKKDKQKKKTEKKRKRTRKKKGKTKKKEKKQKKVDK